MKIIYKIVLALVFILSVVLNVFLFINTPEVDNPKIINETKINQTPTQDLRLIEMIEDLNKTNLRTLSELTYRIAILEESIKEVEKEIIEDEEESKETITLTPPINTLKPSKEILPQDGSVIIAA